MSSEEAPTLPLTDFLNSQTKPNGVYLLLHNLASPLWMKNIWHVTCCLETGDN